MFFFIIFYFFASFIQFLEFFLKDLDVLVMDRLLSDIASKPLLPGTIEEIRKTKVWVTNVVESALKGSCNSETKQIINLSQ